jgi:hypothetical protein
VPWALPRSGPSRFARQTKAEVRSGAQPLDSDSYQFTLTYAARRSTRPRKKSASALGDATTFTVHRRHCTILREPLGRSSTASEPVVALGSETATLIALVALKVAVVLSIAVGVLALVVLLARMVRRLDMSMRRSPQEVAEILRRFIVGEPTGHLADDFIHSPISNPQLESIRERFEYLVDSQPSWEPQAPFPAEAVPGLPHSGSAGTR